MTTKAVYVLKTSWSWDNENKEYATITIEEPEWEYEALLDPGTSAGLREVLMDNLLAIASAQNFSTTAAPSLVALYRICGPGDYKWVKEEDEGNGIVNLSIQMKLVCSFDWDGKLIPIAQASQVG